MIRELSEEEEEEEDKVKESFKPKTTGYSVVDKGGHFPPSP